MISFFILCFIFYVCCTNAPNNDQVSILISGTDEVIVGEQFNLTLSSNVENIISWTINWGDSKIETFPGLTVYIYIFSSVPKKKQPQTKI